MKDFNLADLEGNSVGILLKIYSKVDLQNISKILISLEEENNNKFRLLISGNNVTIKNLQDVWEIKNKLSNLQKKILEAIFEIEKREIAKKYSSPNLKESDNNFVVIDSSKMKATKTDNFNLAEITQFEKALKNEHEISCEIEVFFDTMAPIPLLLQHK